MGLAERVSADDQRNGLLVVHRHAPEGLPNHFRGGGWVRFAARPLRIDVDQAHVIGPKRPLHLSNRIAGVTFVAKPGVLRPPEDLFRLPDVWPAESEAKSLEPHVLHGDVAGEYQQVRPGNLAAVL